MPDGSSLLRHMPNTIWPLLAAEAAEHYGRHFSRAEAPYMQRTRSGWMLRSEQLRNRSSTGMRPKYCFVRRAGQPKSEC
jgi:hypothetical protein